MEKQQELKEQQADKSSEEVALEKDNQETEKAAQKPLSATELKYQEKQKQKKERKEKRFKEIECKKAVIKEKIDTSENFFSKLIYRLQYFFVFLWGKIQQHIGAFCKRYFIDAFSGMAMGLFCTLIIGTIIEQIGKLCGDTTAVGITIIQIGAAAKMLMGAGIGIGVAHALKAPKLAMFSGAAAGFIGAFAVAISDGAIVQSGAYNQAGELVSGTFYKLSSVGDPVSSFIAAVVGVEIGSIFVGKTKIDILAIPLITIAAGAGIALLIGPGVSWFMSKIGELVTRATDLQPILMGMVVALIFGLALTLPTSSAALGMMLWAGAPSSIAMAAAAVGCACHMVGFAVASFRENKWSGLVAQGLGTSMLQIPNLMRNFKIIIPAVVASLICGPIATAGFGLLCNAQGSGMGTSGLVGVIMMMSESGVQSANVWIGMLLTMFILPAIIAFLTSEILRKVGWIRKDDMKLEL